MALRGLLRHPLAIITPSAPDVDNLDDAGYPVTGSPSVVLVPGLIQPRDSRELGEPLNEGVMTTDFLIFLEVQPLSAASYIVHADDDGPTDGSRRYQITGIQAFEYGSSPHLEVYATLMVGNFDKGLILAGS